MANRYAEKIRRRKEWLKKNKTSGFFFKLGDLWFLIPSIVLFVIVIYLIYQSYINDSANQFIIPLLIFSVPLFIFLVLYLPKLHIRSLHIEPGKGFAQEKERLKLEDDTRKTVAQIVGGVVLLGSILFTYNTFRLQQESFSLAQEGQFTDRFTKAVEQIGSDKLEVRLGGLYALERIAKDSPKDHSTVMEILVANVRANQRKEETILEKNKNNPNNLWC